jgi:hypothetical protein
MLSAFSRPALTPMEDSNQLQSLPAYSVRNYEPSIRNDKLASPKHSDAPSPVVSPEGPPPEQFALPPTRRSAQDS